MNLTDSENLATQYLSLSLRIAELETNNADEIILDEMKSRLTVIKKDLDENPLAKSLLRSARIRLIKENRMRKDIEATFLSIALERARDLSDLALVGNFSNQKWRTKAFADEDMDEAWAKLISVIPKELRPDFLESFVEVLEQLRLNLFMSKLTEL